MKYIDRGKNNPTNRTSAIEIPEGGNLIFVYQERTTTWSELVHSLKSPRAAAIEKLRMNFAVVKLGDDCRRRHAPA
jgi:hypothetical protein